ncbi:hypothetical protein LXA43DRAFT_190553, partial [Ganoderma leucocontextum]
MSQTSSTQSQHPPYVFDAELWAEIRPVIRENLVGVALPFALYGIFVLLCGASIHSLVQHNNRTRPTTLILSLALLALFSSTTVYTVISFLGILEQSFIQVVYNGLDLWNIDSGLGGAPPSDFSMDSEQFISCAPTATLTINILLGDAIVCWRACVLWRGNRILMGACIMLLLTTFALGTADTKYACSWEAGGSWQPDPHADGTGSLYQGFSYGVAATVLSLSTNLFSTAAVMVKAWQSRRTLKRYVVTGPMVSQTEKVFSLLIESGAIYCALWVMVLAWQAGTYMGMGWIAGDNSFWDIFNVIMNGALVPLIAIYPTVIIVLVALSRSHVESGFTKTSSQSSVCALPLRPLTVAVN